MLQSAEKLDKSRDAEQNGQVKGQQLPAMHGVKDWLSELISKILSSGDMGSILQQIETSIHKIVGPACQKIHFIVLDDELTNTLARSS